MRRIGVPTVFFFNKVDRGGADVDRVTAQVRQRLGSRPVLLGTVTGQGTREARGTPWASTPSRWWPRWRRSTTRWPRAGWPTGRSAYATSAGRCAARCAAPTWSRRCLGHHRRRGTPAVRRPGRPAAVRRGAGRTAGGHRRAVDRDGHGRRVWLRLWSGRLRVRDRVRLGDGRPEPVTEIAVIEPAGVLVRRSVSAGQIAAVRGVSARIGQHR
ncbi:hypothetical protein V2I01_43280 [Micromonospora sp. BRA006-A]|nr:hypothetical protein [Micromonospora sp. BRA006-A]